MENLENLKVILNTWKTLRTDFNFDILTYVLFWEVQQWEVEQYMQMFLILARNALNKLNALT